MNTKLGDLAAAFKQFDTNNSKGHDETANATDRLATWQKEMNSISGTTPATSGTAANPGR
jgi:hypothetical protein